MKIQLASDLHLDLLGPALRGDPLIRPAPDVDLLVLAGDIANKADALNIFVDWPVPVIYVAGNHEFYHGDLATVRKQMRLAFRGTSIHLLDNDVLELGGVRFLGSILWSDFQVRGFTQRQVMEEAQRRILDFYRIKISDELLTPEYVLADHHRCRGWLRDQLSLPFEGKTVVVTHYGPHSRSIHPQYAGSILNGAFVSDCSELMQHTDLWLHGHTHSSADYRLGRCRVVANPAGYARNGNNANSVDELELENRDFISGLVLEI